MELLIALDLGTSSIRALAFTLSGNLELSFSRIVPLVYPQSGFVEQDPLQILSAALAVLKDLEEALNAQSAKPVSIGITNQRESIIAWDRHNCNILYPLISWQDSRTQGYCRSLESQIDLADLKSKTGLELNPYFSASKIWWLKHNNYLKNAISPTVATLDSFIAWHLMGARSDSPLVTDVSNASRTLLMNLDTCNYDDELLDIFGVNRDWLPEIVPTVSSLPMPIAPGMPFAGLFVTCLIGDQQASLFGHNCLEKGATKATHGTGTFVVSNVGGTRIRPESQVLESVAWQIGAAKVQYCLEGTIFASGSLVRWLRDSLGLISNYSDIESILNQTKSSEGVVFIPAFNGLGTPYWINDVKGTIFGISSTTTGANIVRAGIEGIVVRTHEVVDAIEANLGSELSCLKIDGGLSQSDAFAQLQADQLQKKIKRPRNIEATALGAALLGGIGNGVNEREASFGSLTDVDIFEPHSRPSASNARRKLWDQYMVRLTGNVPLQT